ncbi:MAG TPA: hypothetical protein VKV74_00060 [Bryobacteraceae bacterium]|nr:hypothetical protein [Bryobacteraceae bacterium]
MLLPIAFALGLAGLAFVDPVRHNPAALGSFVGAAALVCLWSAILAAAPRRRTCKLEVALKKQHYLQACAQASVLLYWGWYWPPVYAFAPFILAQLLFAYAVGMLLAWSRRETYTLGFAPFPIIFSINLFLWFRPDWFYFQFAMVAVGIAAKELIRWNKDGQSAHIFNPSSFPLALASLALLAAHASGITRGQEIASTQFYPPHMYLALFLIGLPGQFFFGVTSMTMSAVLAAYWFGRLYFAVTGIYFFYDSYIPIAVFLGMHLLFCDPSTSPRTELGRIVYGALYGLSTVALYELLGRAGMPTFYDKLLPVPLLNLMIKAIDRAARSRMLQALDPAAFSRALLPRQRNLAYMCVWAAAFAVMSATQAVGDDHPGQWLPFWRSACQQGRAFACPYLADLETKFCQQGSGWACNDAGLLHIALSRSGEDRRRLDPAGAAQPLERGCDLGFQTACENLTVLRGRTGSFAAAPPALADYPIILQGSKGPVRQRQPPELYALACRQGWLGACAELSQNRGPAAGRPFPQ